VTEEDGRVDLGDMRQEKHLWRPGAKRGNTRFVLWIVLALFFLAAVSFIAFLILR